MFGTIAGAAFAAVVLAVFGSGLPVACAAALALSVAVLTAPKLYAFSVVGITGSALLASCIGTADTVLPALRLLDTVIGAGVAIVFGYLLWPDSRRLPTTARLDAALPAIRAYLDEAIEQPERRVDWQTRRDDAYRQAHLLRAETEAATTELPPVSSVAISRIPVAVESEELVDAITALAASTESGRDVTPERDRIEQRLRLLESLPIHSDD
ncbi:FUSC family protein [Williamsia sp. 1135]|uniref:FUSC family protein n=1 Tax=Williamsia sp. 1135 TaxID=1889262 RepID=UPI00143C8F67|nr:FUSC family protein [Williamsia sp. 1135]